MHLNSEIQNNKPVHAFKTIFPILLIIGNKCMQYEYYEFLFIIITDTLRYIIYNIYIYI